MNCMSKGLECRYREERNKRKDTEPFHSEELDALRTQAEFWKQKYLDLRRFVDETLYNISLSQQIMPFMPTQQGLLPPIDGKQQQTLVSDPMGGSLGGNLPPFEFYPQTFEGQALYNPNNLLLSNPNLGHTLLGSLDLPPDSQPSLYAGQSFQPAGNQQ